MGICEKGSKGNPGFTEIQADQFYPDTYSNPKVIDPTKLNWFPNLHVTPADDNYQSFNMEPIRPRDVKQTLKIATKTHHLVYKFS